MKIVVGVILFSLLSHFSVSRAQVGQLPALRAAYEKQMLNLDGNRASQLSAAEKNFEGYLEGYIAKLKSSGI